MNYCATAGCANDYTGYVHLRGPDVEIPFCDDHRDDTRDYFAGILEDDHGEVYDL